MNFWVEVAAIALSPVIAVVIATRLQNRQMARGQKLWILQTLVATRHNIFTDDRIRAFNSIDVIYHDSPRVRKHWRELFDLLSNQGLNNETGAKQRNDKLSELIYEMATTLGYKGEINHLDATRYYYPEGMAAAGNKISEFMSQLSDFFRNANASMTSSTKPDNPPKDSPPPLTP